MSLTHADSPVKHRQAKRGKMARYVKTLLKGNTVLKAYCGRLTAALAILRRANDRFGGNLEELRSRLFLGKESPYRLNPIHLGISPEEFLALDILRYVSITATGLDNPKYRAYMYLRRRMDILEQLMSDRDLERVRAIQVIEADVRKSYANLVCDIAEKLHLKCGSVVEESDLIQVGFMALDDAIWGYSDSAKSKFITYAYWTIFRRMVRALGAGNEFGKLINGSEKLLAVYYKSYLDDPEDGSFDSVVERMRIKIKGKEGEFRSPTENEVDILRRIFSRFLRDEDFENKDGQGGIHDIPDPIDDGLDFSKMDLDDLISRSKLTEAEKDIVIRARHGKRGFKARWARKWGLTPMAATKALKRAYGKIENAKKRQVGKVA